MFSFGSQGDSGRGVLLSQVYLQEHWNAHVPQDACTHAGEPLFLTRNRFFSVLFVQCCRVVAFVQSKGTPCRCRTNLNLGLHLFRLPLQVWQARKTRFVSTDRVCLFLSVGLSFWRSITCVWSIVHLQESSLLLANSLGSTV